MITLILQKYEVHSITILPKSSNCIAVKFILTHYTQRHKNIGTILDLFLDMCR